MEGKCSDWLNEEELKWNRILHQVEAEAHFDLKKQKAAQAMSCRSKEKRGVVKAYQMIVALQDLVRSPRGSVTRVRA